MRERMEMDLDLLDFDCEAAECSDARDRAQILATIDTWFKCGRSTKSARGSFNRMVRTSVRAQFHRMAGREWQLPYLWAAFAGLPSWWISWDYFASLAELPILYQCKIVCLAFTAGFLLTPMLLCLVLRLVKIIAYSKSNMVMDVLRYFVVLMVVCTLEIGSSIILVEGARSESTVPYVIAVIIIFAAALHTFAPRRPIRGHVKNNEDGKP
jgi:hypothetical protein